MLTAAIGCATTHGLTRDDLFIRYFSSVTHEYGAPDTRQYEANGHTFEVMFLEKTISQLDTETRPLRVSNLQLREGQTGEMVILRDVLLREETIRPAGTPPGGYVSPGAPVRQTLGSVAFTYLIGPGEGGPVHTAAVFFPPAADTNTPEGATSGLREISGAEFARAFRDITGQDLRRVKLLVENGADRLTVHVIGVDEAGRSIGQYQGGTLCFGMTFFHRRNILRSGLGILIEPGGPDPVTGTIPGI